VEKANMRRIEISKYLGIGERTFYRWQNGEVHIPKTAFLAMYVLVRENLPDGFLEDSI
jgi:predicted DNA-binding transcriptional regulator AlpA